ncbi:unnamed protein product [Parnassius apollo]|uniref:(apollo) hypothetical protein n=1 Tax=Parnassius apollo TaxID=110799 RepID=A0A8S3X6U1_PARAO|nr:unnamed protein product [Parnassius apollo]
MWNPGNKPVPQEFIDVLLDEEEELDIDEDHGELEEEYDAEEILNMPVCIAEPDGSLFYIPEEVHVLNIPVGTEKASGSPQCPTGEVSEEVHVLNIPVGTERAGWSPQCTTEEVSGEVHVLDVPAPEPAPEVPGEVHVLDVPAPEPAPEVPGEVHVLDVPAPEPAPEVPGEVHVLNVPAPEPAPGPFFTEFISPPLRFGITREVFRALGKVPEIRDLLIIKVRGNARAPPHLTAKIDGIPSEPVPLVESSLFKTINTWSLVTEMLVIKLEAGDLSA